MKNIKLKLTALLAAMAAIAMGHAATLRAAETNAAPGRIGIYDSRVVAYAHFWSEPYQRKLNETVKAAKEAKTAGQTGRFKELEAAIKKSQGQSHLQVFSTAPVDDALAEIKDRLPAIQKEAGVSKLVSKWDETTLKQFSNAEQVDVTDVLAREFKPGEKQLKMIQEIKKKKPAPLDQMKNMKGH